MFIYICIYVLYRFISKYIYICYLLEILKHLPWGSYSEPKSDKITPKKWNGLVSNPPEVWQWIFFILREFSFLGLEQMVLKKWPGKERINDIFFSIPGHVSRETCAGRLH